jgi:hypothetical protein
MSKTLDQAREEFFDKAVTTKGGTCECCERWGKVHKRPFNSGMALGIIWLVYTYRQTSAWINVPTTAPRAVVKNREFDKLELWQLAVRKANVDKTKRDSGLWAPTQLGCDFVDEKATVKSHVWLYNSRRMPPFKFSDDPRTIRGALGNKFDYQELMAGRWPMLEELPV